ncbi:MAG: heliorhodopsin HeR [Acidimicrobiia bacterium]|nr:heliorhodopsin HeR [Acidimicrobiia bacterium]
MASTTTFQKPIDPVVEATSESQWTRLRWYNIGMGSLHAIQGIIVLILANDFSLPVTGAFLDGPPGVTDPTLTELFRYSVAWGVALFLFMSAIAHFTVSLGAFGWYKANLMRDRNYARWIEYSFSSSLMVVLIASLSGISDVAALLAIAGVNAAMILFGWIMEKYEIPGNPSWLSYWFGVITGAVPWIAIFIYLLGPGADGSPPGFVWGIFISLFIFFNTFAINMVLQYRKVGRWKNYLFGESVYIFLSLTAKSALAWQIFGGTLAV